ncbi:unnamed protein product [Auanema sp. JU1783]|nr:unnamed protein product [Auanema sp. JU1783]
MTVGETAVDIAVPASKMDELVKGSEDSSVTAEDSNNGIDGTLKMTISPSVGEPFVLQLNTTEMVQELHQVLLEREFTCHRTCFSLQLNGQTLDNFVELKNIPEVVDGCVIQVVDEPFTLREARIHLRHIRDLLRTVDPVDAANAVDGHSVTYLPSISIQERRDKDKPFDGQPPEYVLPGTKDRALGHLLSTPVKLPQALRNISISSFNPPPGPRKMKGDVLYFYIDTVEKRRLHVTCCTKGFFVNSSTDETFDPSPSSQHRNIYHSVVDLLNVVSPGFKKAYPALIKRRSERQMLDRLPTPYPIFSWVVPPVSVTEDGFRAEDGTLPHRVGYEDHLPGQIRDWNEELQTTYEMPKQSWGDRVIRDRSIFKIHGDFIGAAVKGATVVLDGNAMAINPADEPKTHMFIWNNIFFSLGFDVKDHYKEIGGDAASFTATSADLNGVKAYVSIDDPKLCTLGMAVIDYRGCRVTAQSIIPGILDKEQDQSVIYGSVDFGKTIVSSDKYHEVLGNAAKQLRILPHEVIVGPDGETAKLYSSYETKGIIGNDGRQYVLDLLRTMPPDVHFIKGADVSEKAKELGFPRKHPHELAALRQELVEVFYENKCLQFIRVAAEHVRDVCAKMTDDEKKKNSEIEKDMTKILVDITEGREPTTEHKAVSEALEKAAKEVGSLKPNTCDIRFNPDCYSTTVQHAPTENLEAQRRLLVDAAEFLLTVHIPEFVQHCLECSVTPIDGEALSELLQARGINIRYLGEIAKIVEKASQTTYMKTLVVGEIACRCIKRILRTFIHPLQQDKLATAVSHMLRAVFGSSSNDERLSPDERHSKKNNKKPKKSTANEEWLSLTPKSLWKSVCDEAFNYYGYKLEVDDIDALNEKFGVQKISVLRRLCKTLGIQLLNRDFHFDSSKGKPVFTEDDIQGMFPVIKHRQPISNDAKMFYQQGQKDIQMGNLREAYTCIAESVNSMTSIYGALHSDLAQALRTLARISYIMGDIPEALAQQHKAAIISERCNGIDHGNTIIEYINLAHFAFANLHVSAALKLLYRARYLLLIAHGEKHPVMTQIDANIGIILFAVQEFDSALKYLQSAKASIYANGEPRRLKYALVEHSIAICNASRGDFRAALSAEKETYSIYLNMFGPENIRVQDSSEFLKLLTQQAVHLQKRMMDVRKNNSIARLLPVQVQQPPLSTILDIMNIMNGIIIISMPATEEKDIKSEEKENRENSKKELSDEALD